VKAFVQVETALECHITPY